MMPTYINRYQIIGQLGEGGMGTVYLAYDPNTGREVAVKVLPPEFLRSRTFQTRFTREKKIMGSLRHRAIVPVYDSGEDNGSPFIVMPLMAGGSLKDSLSQGPLPSKQIASILAVLADALDEFHKKNIIHRDLKPSNILFDENQNPYISDFGIARDFNDAQFTASGSIFGTPAYMSPEQASNPSNLDGRSDIYSLGCILFEMLTGKHPYHESSGLALLYHHANTAIPELNELRSDLSSDWQNIVNKAMAKKTEERYSTAKELSDAVQNLVSSSQPKPEPEPESSPNKLLSILLGLVGTSVGLLLLIDALPSINLPSTIVGIPFSNLVIFVPIGALIIIIAFLVAQRSWSRFRKTIKEHQRISYPIPPPSQPVANPTRRPQGPASQKPPPQANNQDKDTTVVDNSQVSSTPKSNRSSSLANTLISDKPKQNQKTVALTPDGQGVMKQNKLSESLLKTHLGRINRQLSNEGATRLFLTGFGTFGGTSLVRATTFKLMQRLKSSQEGKALVIRFDTSNRSDLHEYQLVVNENDVSSIAYPFREDLFSQELDEVLGQEANQIRKETHSFSVANRFRDMTAFFAQGEQNHTNSTYSDLITQLISQVLKLLEFGSDKHEIRQAIENLRAHPSSSETKQIILIIDWLQQEDAMQRLFNSPFARDKFRNLELSLIVLVRYETFSRWSDSFRERIRKSNVITYHYVERLWDKRFDMKKMLNDFMDMDSLTLSKKERDYFDNFLAHLTYKAQGSTARLMRELKQDYLTDDGQQMAMNLEEIYERKRDEIEHNVDIQKLLDHNWSKIIGKKRLKSTEKKDQAKIGVYHIIEWIRNQEELFDTAKLRAVAGQQEIMISDSEYAREKILGHLLRLLVGHKYLKCDPKTGHYELADEDHWHIDPVDDVSGTNDRDDGDDGDKTALYVAIVGDVTTQEEEVNTLLEKMAFELVSAGYHLVTADFMPISALIRLQLAYYVLLDENGVSSEQKPLLLIETMKDQVIDQDSEEVKSATDERHALEILLEEADVVVFAQREPVHSSIFTWQKVKSEAKKQDVPIIPVGAIGRVSEYAWDEFNHNLDSCYDKHIEKDLFAKIGPSQTYVPDVARAVVEIAKLLGK